MNFVEAISKLKMDDSNYLQIITDNGRFIHQVKTTGSGNLILRKKWDGEAWTEWQHFIFYRLMLMDMWGVIDRSEG